VPGSLVETIGEASRPYSGYLPAGQRDSLPSRARDGRSRSMAYLVTVERTDDSFSMSAGWARLRIDGAPGQGGVDE